MSLNNLEIFTGEMIFAYLHPWAGVFIIEFLLDLHSNIKIQPKLLILNIPFIKSYC